MSTAQHITDKTAIDHFSRDIILEDDMLMAKRSPRFTGLNATFMALEKKPEPQDAPAARKNDGTKRSANLSGPEGASETAKRALAPPGLDWDADDFLKRLRNAEGSGDKQAIKSLLRDVAEHNYLLSSHPDFVGKKGAPETRLIPSVECLAKRHSLPLGAKPRVVLSACGTGDALLRLGRGRDAAVCCLSFANGAGGAHIGGGYKRGARAQEEDLCRQIPGFYTSLYRASRKLYPFGPTTYKGPRDPGRYSDVAFTPNLLVKRSSCSEGYKLLSAEESATVGVVSAAAPNVAFGSPPDVFVEDLVALAIQAIFVAPKLQDPRVDTLVLGAWGCGAFGNPPETMAKHFAHVLDNLQLGRLYREVHFAIPHGGPNFAAFEKVLRAAGAGIGLEVAG